MSLGVLSLVIYNKTHAQGAKGLEGRKFPLNYKPFEDGENRGLTDSIRSYHDFLHLLFLFFSEIGFLSIMFSSCFVSISRYRNTRGSQSAI